MKRIFCAIMVACVLVTPSPGLGDPENINCERLEQQRNRVYAQLRKGHSVARARQLKAKLRELQASIAQNCH